MGVGCSRRFEEPSREYLAQHFYSRLEIQLARRHAHNIYRMIGGNSREVKQLVDLSIVVKNLWWLVPTILILQVLRTSRFKGWYGEFKVKVALQLKLKRNQYHAFHNVMLPAGDGGTTQIDHILVSKYGIFVIETNNRKGWIFGGPQAAWTQQIHGNNYSFQNPLRQNYKHTKALEALIDIPEHAIYPIIVFVGRSTFGTVMPEGVTRSTGGLVHYIKSRGRPVLTSKQVQTVASIIESNRQKATRKIQREHVNKIRSRPTCQECGSLVVPRIAKKGNNPGQRFWGCPQYPRCRSTQPLSQ